MNHSFTVGTETTNQRVIITCPRDHEEFVTDIIDKERVQELTGIDLVVHVKRCNFIVETDTSLRVPVFFLLSLTHNRDCGK